LRTKQKHQQQPSKETVPQSVSNEQQLNGDGRTYWRYSKEWYQESGADFACDETVRVIGPSPCGTNKVFKPRFLFAAVLAGSFVVVGTLFANLFQIKVKVDPLSVSGGPQFTGNDKFTLVKMWGKENDFVSVTSSL
jgi:hypothetical protein